MATLNDTFNVTVNVLADVTSVSTLIVSTAVHVLGGSNGTTNDVIANSNDVMFTTVNRSNTLFSFSSHEHMQSDSVENTTVYDNQSNWNNGSGNYTTSTGTEFSLLETIIICVVVTIVSIITAFGNLMVMIAFKMDKKLQTVSNYFLLSLAVADMMIGIISMPLYTLYIILGVWPLGPIVCDLWLSLDYAMSNASVANLLVISFDRYLSVTRPLTYRAKRTPKRAGILICYAWVISFLLWPPWIFGWPYIEGKRSVPEDNCYIQFLVSNPTITVITAIIAFYIPVTIMMVLYFRIYMETEKRQKGLFKLQGGKQINGSKKSTVSSEEEGLSSMSQRRSDSSPDLEEIDDFTDTLPRNRTNPSCYQRCIGCCKIDRDTDYAEESSSSDPPGSPVESVTPSNISRINTNSSIRKDLCLNATVDGKRRRSASNLMIPLLSVEPKGNSSNSTPCTEITGTFSRHSNLSSATGMTETDAMLVDHRAEAMYTILIRLPGDNCRTTGSKPSIRMIPDIEETEFMERNPRQLSEDSESSDITTRDTADDSIFHQQNCVRYPPLPPPTGTPALGRRVTPSSDVAKVAMQTRIVNKVSSQIKAQRAKKRRFERKQDKKAAKTLSAILLAFIITWTPYNIFAISETFCYECVPSELYNLGEYISIYSFN